MNLTINILSVKLLRLTCPAHNSWQAQFGRFGRLKLFPIFGVHGKLKVHVPKSRTAACQQIVIGHFKRRLNTI
jgi:hypothetical protein